MSAPDLNAYRYARAPRDDKAAFRMIRDMLGHSQPSMASALGVHVNSVKRWEREDKPNVPSPEIMDELYGMLAAQAEQVRFMADKAQDLLDAAAADGMPATVQLPYYRTQEEYDRCHDDGGYFGCANAVVRAVAREIDPEGNGWAVVGG